MTEPALPVDDDGVAITFGRVWGHHLIDDGEAYLAVDCYTGRCSTNVRGTTRQANAALESVGGPGHGLCACGVLSEHLDTGRARRRWHRRHKARVILDVPEPDGQPAPIDPLDTA